MKPTVTHVLDQMVKERLGEAADDLNLRTREIGHIVGDEGLYGELCLRVRAVEIKRAGFYKVAR